VAQSGDGFGWWWGLLAFVAGSYVFEATSSNYPWFNSAWYSVRYGVGFGDVHTDTRPTDCDFLRAPLGAKGCNYKAQVQVFNADGLLVAGDNAPVYGNDTKTAKPIISYDAGKTWEWYKGAAIPNPMPKSVKVLWVRE
jgi:hypothetical protein